MTALKAVSPATEICRQSYISSTTREMLTAPGCLLLFIFKLFYCWFMLTNVTYT